MPDKTKRDDDEGLGGVSSPPKSGSPGLSREDSTQKKQRAHSLAIVSIVCGAKHCLALTRAGYVFSWGCNRFGQLGLQRSTSEYADFESRGEPVRVLGKLAAMVATTDFVRADLKRTESEAAIQTDGASGTDGAAIYSGSASTRMTGDPVIQVVAGWRHSMALTASGACFAWGQAPFVQQRTQPLPPLNPKSTSSYYSEYLNELVLQSLDKVG
jgi:alpha-tubulin suppressor-like RCC1 family protein